MGPVPGPDGDPLRGVLLFALVAIAPTVLFWVLLRSPGLAERIRRRWWPTPPVPLHPPVERIAADLRRLRRMVERPAPGTSALRRQSAQQAYDDLLAEACAALGVTHRMATAEPGMDRDVERLRVEDALRRGGLVLR